MSLRSRIAFVVAASTAVAVLVIAGVMLFAARRQARNTLDDTLEERAAAVELFGRGIIPSRGRGERPFGRFIPDDVLVQIIYRNGDIVDANVDPIPVSNDDIVSQL